MEHIVDHGLYQSPDIPRETVKYVNTPVDGSIAEKILIIRRAHHTGHSDDITMFDTGYVRKMKDGSIHISHVISMTPSSSSATVTKSSYRLSPGSRGTYVYEGNDSTRHTYHVEPLPKNGVLPVSEHVVVTR